VILDPTPELLREQMVTAMKGFPITELLPEQRRYIDLYREEYFRIGSSTEPADRPRAEAAITALYAAIGKPPPSFEWGPSPRWGSKRAENLVTFSLHSLWDSLWDSIRFSILHSLNDSILESLRSVDWETLQYALRRSPGTTKDSIFYALSGSGDGFWISHYIYMIYVLMVPSLETELARLRLHDEVARSCGWWWPGDEMCICTDRPEIFDLSNETPYQFLRLRYRDGFEVKL
jgi:hypothetical protein